MVAQETHYLHVSFKSKPATRLTTAVNVDEVDNMSKKQVMSRIPNDYIYRAVWQHCPTASKDQVREVFKAYSEVLNALIDTPNRPKDLAVPLPYIGDFYLVYKKGKKAGSKIGGVMQTLNGGVKGERIDNIIIKEDKPDYELLSFKVSTTLNKYIRKITSEYIQKHKDSKELERKFNERT